MCVQFFLAKASLRISHAGLSILWEDDNDSPGVGVSSYNHGLYQDRWYSFSCIIINHCKPSLSEKDQGPVTRLITLLIAFAGLYPQYRAMRTILMGRGWIEGDWEVDHKYNNRNLYVIEPLVESLLQVPTH